jgi:hypothetical protein
MGYDKPTVMAATFHSAPILGISLCALLRPSLTPVRSLTVKGISPSARFIPTRIFPSFPAASSTVDDMSDNSLSTPYLKKRTYELSHCPFEIRGLSDTRSLGPQSQCHCYTLSQIPRLWARVQWACFLQPVPRTWSRTGVVGLKTTLPWNLKGKRSPSPLTILSP